MMKTERIWYDVGQRMKVDPKVMAARMNERKRKVRNFGISHVVGLKSK